MSGDNSDISTGVGEVVTVLASGDDSEELQKAAESCRKAREFERTRNLEMKSCMEALSKIEEQGTKTKISLRQEKEENQENIVSLKDKERETTTAIKNLNVEVTSVQEARKQLEVGASKMREEKDDIKNETVEVLAKTKYEFSLYSNITRIRWDYEAEEGQLKGYVASLRDVRPFAVNVKENNKYYTANFLWDVISSS